MAELGNSNAVCPTAVGRENAVARRVQELLAAHPELSEEAAQARILSNDRQLYMWLVLERQRRQHTQKGAPVITWSDRMQARIAMLRKQKPALSALEAQREVIRNDPELYENYRRESWQRGTVTVQKARTRQAVQTSIVKMVTDRCATSGRSFGEELQEFWRDHPEEYEKYQASQR
jgi:hypothetical protein